MKKLFALGAALLTCGLGVYGCSNTAEGAKEDTAQNTAKVQDAGEKAASAVDKAADSAAANVKDAAKDTSAALSLTPKVKEAITADAELNDTRNLINVDSKDNVVHLKGHVISEALKSKAGQIAEKTLKDANATDTVSNELEVNPAAKP